MLSSQWKTLRADQPRPPSSQNSRWWRLLGLLCLGALAAGLSFYFVGAKARAQVPVGLEGLERFDKLQRTHVETSVTYPTVPPVGGNHASVFQNCGIYLKPIPNETATHSLEHGSVWIAYRPDIKPKDLEVLHKLVLGKEYMLLSPYPGLAPYFSMVAWGARLQFERLEIKRVKRFMQVFAPNKAAPEFGGYCLGGTGQPIIN
jgi:hypothetical protein